MSPILQMRKQRPRDVKQLVQRCTAGKTHYSVFMYTEDFIEYLVPVGAQ